MDTNGNRNDARSLRFLVLPVSMLALGDPFNCGGDARLARFLALGFNHLLDVFALTRRAEHFKIRYSSLGLLQCSGEISGHGRGLARVGGGQLDGFIAFLISASMALSEGRSSRLAIFAGTGSRPGAPQET